MKKIALLSALCACFASSAFAQGPAAYLSRDASGAVVTTSVYQTVDAYNPNQMRHGCTIQNTSANAEQVRVGTVVFNLAAGTTFNCQIGGIVVADTIAITSATVGSSYSAAIQ